LPEKTGRGRASISLILNLLSPSGPDRLALTTHFGNESPLFKYHLLERVEQAGNAKPALLGQSLMPDEAIVSWLLGAYQAHTEIETHAVLITPQINDTDKLLAAEACSELQNALRDGEPIIAFTGPDEARQQGERHQLGTRV